MVRTDEKASAESKDGEWVVMIVAPGVMMWKSDRRIAKTRDGKPVWIRPRRGVRGGAPAAQVRLYSECLTRPKCRVGEFCLHLPET